MFASDYFQSEKAFRAMLPGKIALTALRIAESERITPREALGRFYASATYRSLEDESTKSWWESPRELQRDYDTQRTIRSRLAEIADKGHERRDDRRS